MWNVRPKGTVENENKLFILSIIFIIVVLSAKMGVLKDPYFTDEIGYWAAGAYFSGIDWSGVMTKSAYYGYGYGIFLAPLFLLKDSTLMFYGAIIINIMFVLGTFFNVYAILRKITSNISKKENILIACISCCYPSVVVYSNITMAEICLTFMVSLLIRVTLECCKKVRTDKIIIMAFIAAFMVAIHLRELIVVLSLIVFLLLILILRKCKVRDVAVFGITLMIFLCFVFVIKKGIVNELYTDRVTQIHIGTNDNLSDQLWFFSRLLDLEFWKYYVRNVMAKIYYLSLSSFFIFNMSIVYLFQRLVKGIKKKDNSEIRSFLFLGILIVMMILYAAILTPHQLPRLDQLFYGRYIEIIMPVYLGIGFISFLEISRKEKRKVFIISYMFCLFFSIIGFYCLKQNNLTGVNPVIMPIQMTGFAGLPGIKEMEKMVAVTFYATLGIGMIGITIYILTRKYDTLKCIFIGTMWIVLAYNAVDNYLYNMNETIDITERTKINRYEKIKEVADYIDTITNGDVYYLYEGGRTNADYFEMFCLQYDLVDTLVKTISSENINSISDGKILVVHYCNEFFYDIRNNFSCLFDNGMFIVLKSEEINKKGIL